MGRNTLQINIKNQQEFELIHKFKSDCIEKNMRVRDVMLKLIRDYLGK